MNIQDLQAYVSKLSADVRKRGIKALPLHVAVPLAVVALVIMFAGGRLIFGGHDAASRGAQQQSAGIAAPITDALAVDHDYPRVIAAADAAGKASRAKAAEAPFSTAPGGAIQYTPATSAPTPANPATASSAGATTAPAAEEPAPPAGAKAGWMHEVVLGKDQYNQWLTVHQRVIKLPSLNIAVPQPQGTSGVERTQFAGWIQTVDPVTTLELHIVGGNAVVQATIDQVWKIHTWHSNGFSATATEQQAIVNLQPGWHHVVLDVDRQPGMWDAGTTPVELQLGTATTDPSIPVPWAVPPRTKAAASVSASSAAHVSAAAARASTTVSAAAPAKAKPVPAATVARHE